MSTHSTSSIFGVTIDNVDYLRTIAQVGEWLRQPSATAKLIVTPNPEILLVARTNTAYAAALNAADLRLPDGFGLRLVPGIDSTVHGADIATFCLKKAAAKHLRVGCVIRQDGLSSADSVNKSLTTLAPGCQLRVVAIKKGDWEDPQTVDQLKSWKPDVLLVGIGFPEQELWLQRFAKQLPGLRISMAIGGTFDFWTGAALRAPHWLRRVHLEWAWRLLRQPSRLPRILRAVFVFPLLATVSRYKK